MVQLNPGDYQSIQNILTNGGTFTINVEVTDINSNGDEFEEYETIKPLLYSGFEFPAPTTLGVKELALIAVYGSPWVQLSQLIYSKGGRIIYKKLGNGVYEALITKII